jgi:hypothetical protein
MILRAGRSHVGGNTEFGIAASAVGRPDTLEAALILREDHRLPGRPAQLSPKLNEPGR